MLQMAVKGCSLFYNLFQKPLKKYRK